MPISQNDIRAIEAASDLFTTGMRRLDISSLEDLVTESTVLMPPERRSAKGRAILERWRNMAQSTEGLKLLSTEMQPLGAGHVCDIGTMSFRRKPKGEHALYRYMIVWRQDGANWKLASMMWNRETANQANSRSVDATANSPRAPATGGYKANSPDGLGDM